MSYGVKNYIIINPIDKEIINCTLNDYGYYDTKRLELIDDINIEDITISLKQFYIDNPKYLEE